MSIETECPGCQRRLRVSGEHAGQQARCPVCSTIYSVPAGPQAAPELVAEVAEKVETADPSWRMRTPEGQVYGPVGKQELDQWVADGRVTADCELCASDSTAWQTADRVYAALGSLAGAARTSSRPAPTAEQSSSYRYTAPHRGTLVLVLGVLGWVGFCPLFGIVAWAMGSSDLRAMRAGHMDPSGRGLTQAGMVLGMIQAIIMLCGIVISVFFGLARFVLA